MELRRIGLAGSIALVALITLPSAVAADCNGPACEGVDPALADVQAILFVAILVAFGAVLMVAELRRG